MAFIPISDNVKGTKITDEPKFGTVVDNDDPLQLGRVKVEIAGIFEGDASSMPWVRRKTDTIFCGSDCEIFDVPTVGSIVEVRWSYDDNTPTYSGAPYNQKHQTGSFTDNYPNEAGIKFGPHLIKFNKTSKLLTITNSSVKIVLDPLGGCTIDCTDLDINATRNVNMSCQNFIVNGDMKVDGTFSSTKGANGMITAITAATVSGGMVTSCEAAV